MYIALSFSVTKLETEVFNCMNQNSVVLLTPILLNKLLVKTDIIFFYFKMRKFIRLPSLPGGATL